MKGKVKCPSCGWSWNKSDSSVKDMHVCHNCGKSDVNMKTGGWLDNYNDSSTSAPEGFQGEGYSNVGRNYSPAWGGQFEEGGMIPIAQSGKSIIENTQVGTSRDKRGLNLLIKETKNAKEDEKELYTTGQIKYPKSEKWKKIKKEQEKNKTYVTQDNRSEAVKQYDDEKGRAKEFKKTIIKPIIATADELTDLMQLGNFVPHPYAQTIGKIGNVAGVAIDAYQAADDYSEGNYGSAAINAGSAILPSLLETGSFARNSKYLQPGEVMYPLSPQAFGSPARTKYLELINTTRGSSPFKTNVNRALLGTLGAESIYDIPEYQMGGSVYPVNYVPQAQNGFHSSNIFLDHKMKDWFGTNVNSNPKTINIVDPRKKMATTNQPLRPNSDLVGGKYNSHHLDKLIQEAKRQGLSKQDIMNLSAMGFQETKWGRSDGNIGHVLHTGDDPGSFNDYADFVDAYKAKMKEADRLGIKDPAMRLQVYNGLGTITPNTERKYHGFKMKKIYGVPVPAEGISMKKNPLYGKQVMDIRDNVLAKNPEYMRYMDSIYKAPLPKYMQEEMRLNKQTPPANMRKSSATISSLLAPKKKKQDGGSVPGLVGFSYARTQDPAPSNGPYAKKTKASAKNGDVVVSDRGQWDYPGEITQIDQSKEGSYIDMGPDPETGKPITTPVIAVSDTGDVKLLQPGGKYKLNGTKVTEYPIAQTGKKAISDGRTFLDQLKADAAARKNKVNVREVRTVVNDNIPNAHNVAVKADEKLKKDFQYAEKVKRDEAKAQAEAQKKFNALPKEEQERILYNQYSQEHGTISEYHPDSKLSKFAQSMVTPFTALTDLYQKGEVRDNLLKSVVNNPKTANAYDAAYLGTLGYAAAPYAQSAATTIGSTVAPYMAADAVVGSTTLTGVNLNNLITAGFATHGLTNIAPDTAEWVENPSWKKAEEIGIDALEIAPIAGPAAKTIGEGFNYLGGKGKQALAKTSEFVAPHLNKAKTLANDMGAVMSREVKTIDPKIEALYNAETDIYNSKEYMASADELNDIRKAKWSLEGKLNQMKNKANSSQLNEMNDKINKLQKRIDVAEQFTLNGEGLVQSGKDTALGLRTGSTNIMDLSTGEKFPISTSVPNNNVVHTLEGDKVVKTIDNSTLPQASPEYNMTVKKNIDFIENQIPGAKVFGSAKNVAETEIPHIVGDYDVIMSQSQYEKFAKANPSVGNNGFAELHNIPGAAKGVEPIDINVIQEKGGKAIGVRAEELFKQVAPDEYYQAAKKAIKNKSEIKIPYSSQELVDMTNPTTKSVVDAYESTKDKHLNKIDALINYGKPSVVAEGQQQFVKSLVGNKGSIGHQFPLEQLSNVETNAEILDKIGFIGNKQLVAANPEKMQVAINDYYINNSILTRQVDGSKIDKIEAAIKEYYPGAGGGNVNGIGQNHVMLGHPFHGDGNVVSMKQLGMNLDTTDPISYINSIEHNVSAEKLFSQEERDILSSIIDNIKMDTRYKDSANKSENTAQLIENLPYSEEGKRALYKFAKQTGRTIAKKNSQYGNSTYASTLRDFDEAIDAMQYQVANSRNAIKSYRQRSDAAQYAKNSSPNISPDIELLPKQFKAIKGYVEGGMERAKERLNQLSSDRRKIGEDIEDLADKLHNKKYKEEITRLREFRAKIDKEMADLAQMRNDLYSRRIYLKELERKMINAGLITGSGAIVGGAIAGLSKYADKQNEEFKKKLNSMTKKEKEEYDKRVQERIRKLDSIERQDKPWNEDFMDWFMGRKQNGGSITKAKDGNQLVKLNQLTNFTNYNTKQPGGWLDKYN